MEKPKIRKSGSEWRISQEEYCKRFNENFFDPFFDAYREQIAQLAEVSYQSYLQGRKAPRTQKLGEGYQDPEFAVSIEWLKAKEEIKQAQAEHDQGPLRILLINASHRSDHTCPGEISKTSRLLQLALSTFKQQGIEADILDLSQLTSEYGKKIHPCKACVSTAMPLCHWPCSCYPNHSYGQVQDWMNEIYPLWVRAHGVMIITPVYWHQSPSALKLMMERLVCADGGNPDPSSTNGKDPQRAKELELAGWDYPRHLKGRFFSVVIHGDTVGVDDAKGVLCDWLEEIEMIPCGNLGSIGRYIGYYQPYATSHDALDGDAALQEEVRNAARSLCLAVSQKQQGKFNFNTPGLEDPRPK